MMICMICKHEYNGVENHYVSEAGVHCCVSCYMEWELRKQMAVLGWMKGAGRPDTGPASVNEAVGGTD